MQRDERERTNVSHGKTINKGCVLHTIFNHYLYKIYGPWFWGDNLAHHVFTSASKNMIQHNTSIEHKNLWA